MLSCVGIGVGPSNLSLASLLHSYPRLSGMFFDKKRSFTWHEGMLLSGGALQVSLFKDLVTLSDPRNAFSFVSYLHQTGKLYHFLNARFDTVPRKEFENYLKWASGANPMVHFDEEVVDVQMRSDLFEVRTRKRKVQAKNVSIGIGIAPSVPACAARQLDSTSFHVAEFMQKSENVGGSRVVVVGGGQSGAEVFLNLIGREGRAAPASVAWISRRKSFYPMDDSPFANEYFMPCHSDYFFARDREYRTKFIKRNVLASDGISESTLRAIYQRLYTLRQIDPRPPATTLAPNCSIEGLNRAVDEWLLDVLCRGEGRRETVKADTIVWATGYERAPVHFLGSMIERLQWEGDEILIDGDFAAVWDGPPDCRLFMLNAARAQRGLADPNLSLLAWRSARLLDRIAGYATPRPQAQPAFTLWSGPSLLPEQMIA